jgi:hypothetical protein
MKKHRMFKKYKFKVIKIIKLKKMKKIIKRKNLLIKIVKQIHK